VTAPAAASLLRLARLLPALALAVASGACVLHLGDDDSDGGVCAAADVAGTLLVDPETLACTEFTFGGCGPCGPCPEPLPPIPSWGACQSQCTGLPEVACDQTDGCRSAYDHACLTGDGPCTAFQPFLGCFAIDSTGPAPGSCAGLDAFQCSRHDNCLATYRDDGLCGNGRDDDRDGQVDEADECRRFGVCLPEIGAE
jgi:hypothetical protein